MPEREHSLNRETGTDHIDKYIHGLTFGYINGLRGLPSSRLLQVRRRHPSLAHVLRIKSADERVKAESEKFKKGFTGFIEGYKRYLPPSEPNSMGVFTRIICVTAGIELIAAANQTFDDFPYFRNPLIHSARDLFQYGAQVSQEYGEEIDQSWLNEFMLNVVMQSTESWKSGGREEFPERIAQFREPLLIT